MDMATASIIVAVITAVGGIIVAAINKFRKENHNDHAYVRGMLTMLYKSQNRIESKVDRVDDRLSNHLESHALEGMLDNGRTIHQDGAEANSKVS
jgi:lipopolysaccharide biosynthesis regulator YciM